MMSLNAEPESASVSCQRSRLTTIGSGRPASCWLISMSSSAADGVVLVDGPVEPAGAGVAVDGRVLRHDVVAAFGVVVVLADLADEDVVAGSDLGRVVEERCTVVALEEVLAGATLDPVVATVTEHGVGALTGDDEVVAGTGERLVVVGAAVDEVLAVVAHRDVVARTGVDGVVAGAALGMSAPSRSVMMSLPSPPSATSSPPLPSMTSLTGATPEGVVVVAAVDPVDAGACRCRRTDR